MLRSSKVLLALLVVSSSLSIACARSETPPAATERVATASTGDVSIAAASTPAGPGALTDSVSTNADKGRIRGAANAPVWLVEISDFQCSFCKQWHDQIYPTIDREYVQTGKVRMAYLNYPMSRIHPNARAAAEAAMCASVQGKFWQLHSALFDTQKRWADLKSPMAMFDSLARASGVEHKGWTKCMTTHATAKLIDADFDRTSKAGVESTPSFFIGDRALVGVYPVDSFRVAIDQAIAKAQAPR